MMQFVCTLYAGTFLGFTLCHIVGDMFVNALVGGMADALANATSGPISKRFGLLRTYRAMAVVTLLCWSSLQWLDISGMFIYLTVFIATFTIGCCLNFATATIVDQTPPDQLKGI